MRETSTRGNKPADEIPGSSALRKLTIAAGVACAALFVVIGLAFQFHLFGDGALFAYAVAVQDSWNFHWHNISNRSTVYLYAHIPAEIYGRVSGDAEGAIRIYGFQFFSAQAMGLALTYWLDRSVARTVFVFACASTAILCPLIFGAPTEMWFAHALFWPALAAAHFSPLRWAGVAAFLTFLPLAFSHEGALVFVAAILLSLMIRREARTRFYWCLAAAAMVIAIWLAVRVTLPPDDYTARTLSAAASNVFDPKLLFDRMLILLAAVAGGFLLLLLALRRLQMRHAPVFAFLIVGISLAAYWLLIDSDIHAARRYYLRTVVIVLTPALGAATICLAFESQLIAIARRALEIMRSATRYVGANALAGLLLLVLVVHAVETARFAAAWRTYLSTFRGEVMQAASDAEVDPTDPKYRGLAWFSTLPYLSVLVAPGFTPKRLAIDPRSDYFWISCADATASVRKAIRYGIPAESRQMIRNYNCKNRP